MLQPFTTVEEAKIGLLAYLRELAQHPAINVNPESISVDVSARYRRRHATCRWRQVFGMKTWTIIFNLPVLRANLDNPSELEHTCQHEIAHVRAPNHGPQFRKVCRALGIPEDRIGAKTSHLRSAKSEELWVCLRCGTKKSTFRAHTNKLKRCDWCGSSWDAALDRIDRSKTMAMFKVEDAVRISNDMAVPGKDRHLKTRWLPWKEYATYLRDGGEMTVMSWWLECLKLGMYPIPEKYVGKGLTPEIPAVIFGEATAIKNRDQ